MSLPIIMLSLIALFLGIQLSLILIAWPCIKLSTEKNQTLSFTNKVFTKKNVLVALIVCRLALLLPYRIREGYVIALHLVLHSMKERFLLIFRFISKSAFISLLLLTYLFYLFTFPFALLLKKKHGFHSAPFNPNTKKSY